jgi:hypothetical protein
MREMRGRREMRGMRGMVCIAQHFATQSIASSRHPDTRDIPTRYPSFGVGASDISTFTVATSVGRGEDVTRTRFEGEATQSDSAVRFDFKVVVLGPARDTCGGLALGPPCSDLRRVEEPRTVV